MARKRARRDPVLVEVLAALGASTLQAAHIVDGAHPDACVILGLQQGKRIYVNEAELIVPVLVHELLHAVRPEWSERGVERRTTQVVRQLSQDEVQRVYGVYQERKSNGGKKVS